MERDAGGGEENEHGVGRVVEEGVGKEAAGGGDERRGAALGGFGRDETAGKEAGEGWVVGVGRVGVDVDVEDGWVLLAGLALEEEEFPKSGKWKRVCGHEHKGYFLWCTAWVWVFMGG